MERANFTHFFDNVTTLSDNQLTMLYALVRDERQLRATARQMARRQVENAPGPVTVTHPQTPMDKPAAADRKSQSQ